MDTNHFAALLRSLSAAASRRDVFTALTGGLLAAGPFRLGVEETEAKKNRRRRRNRKQQARRKKRKQQNQNLSPPAPITRPDATCSGPDNGDASNPNDNGRLAETFTALASGPLVSAQLLLRKDTEEESNWILRLSPVDGSGVPTNAVLAETSLADASVPDGISTVTFTFATPFSVVAGNQYALVLTRLGGARVSWRFNTNNPCSGQAYTSTSQTGAFSAQVAGADFVVTNFVSS